MLLESEYRRGGHVEYHELMKAAPLPSFRYRSARGQPCEAPAPPPDSIPHPPPLPRPEEPQKRTPEVPRTQITKVNRTRLRSPSSPQPKPQPLPMPVAGPSRARIPPPRRSLPNPPTVTSTRSDDLRRVAAINKAGQEEKVRRRQSTGSAAVPNPAAKRAAKSRSASPLPEAAASTSRSTRRSAPIAASLADLVSSPQVLAASGGFDYSTGRYISKGQQTTQPPSSVSPSVVRGGTGLAGRNRRSSSARSSPRPLTPRRTSAADGRSGAVASTVLDPSQPRSSRNRAPIAGSIQDLVYSPAALVANGGWSAEEGRYYGSRKRRGGLGMGTSSSGAGAEGGDGEDDAEDGVAGEDEDGEDDVSGDEHDDDDSEEDKHNDRKGKGKARGKGRHG